MEQELQDCTLHMWKKVPQLSEGRSNPDTRKHEGSKPTEEELQPREGREQFGKAMRVRFLECT